MTVTEQGFAMLAEIRKECGLADGCEIDEPKVIARKKVCRRQKRYLILKGERPLGYWIADRALKDGLSTATVWDRYYNGEYNLEVRQVNSRVIFVKEIGDHSSRCHPMPGEVRLRDWVKSTAKSQGVSRSAIWMRYYRGIYDLKIRRASHGFQFVQITA